MENIKPEKDLKQSVEESTKFGELWRIFEDKYLPSLEITGEEYLICHNKVLDFSKKIIDKYGYAEVIKRQLFHIIAGSGGMDHSKCPYFDFEGEDSIEKFINEL
jgi:hypothetical protein